MDNTLLDLQNSSYPTQPHSIISNNKMEKNRGIKVKFLLVCVYLWLIRGRPLSIRYTSQALGNVSRDERMSSSGTSSVSLGE